MIAPELVYSLTDKARAVMDSKSLPLEELITCLAEFERLKTVERGQAERRQQKQRRSAEVPADSAALRLSLLAC